MKQYLFVLGRTPKLASLELDGIASSITHLRSDIILGYSDLSPLSLMQTVGGTLKVSEVVYTGNLPTTVDIDAILSKEVRENKLVFGMSTYSETEPISVQMLRELKERFVSRGIHTRFIQSKHGTSLSSVVITKQKVIELVLVESNGVWPASNASRSDAGWYVAVTRAVQDFEQWNERDFSRPFSDPKNGMLPPKVARMIVNIAKSTLVKTMGKIELPILLDPFCGTGTILSEALIMGWRIIGADISEAAIQRTRKNVAWARSRYALKDAEMTLYTHDATHISERIISPLHAIVTEPYMGNTNASSYGKVIELKKAKNIVKGLEKLYIGCLREWYKILVKGGVVVIALPQYVIGKETVFVKKVVDRCESLGYTLVVGPIEYGRPDAVVRREFFVFKKI